jgi:hypothetical protein
VTDQQAEDTRTGQQVAQLHASWMMMMMVMMMNIQVCDALNSDVPYLWYEYPDQII